MKLPLVVGYQVYFSLKAIFFQVVPGRQLTPIWFNAKYVHN